MMEKSINDWKKVLKINVCDMVTIVKGVWSSFQIRNN